MQHGLHDGTRPSQPPTTIPCGTTESLATKSGAVPAPRQQEPEPTKHPRQTASAGRHSHPSDKVFVKFPVSAEETYLGNLKDVVEYFVLVLFQNPKGYICTWRARGIDDLVQTSLIPRPKNEGSLN